MWRERRSSDRHVIELPIKYRIIDDVKKKQSNLRSSRVKNLCDGGLLFLSSERFENGTLLELTLPIKDQIFILKGRVVHVDHADGSRIYKIGIQFPSATHIFKLKMAEQLRQITHYQQKLSEDEGRAVSEEEAAQKWIEVNSGMFAEFYKT